MRILVLNGSPKKDKSDVMCITRAFLEGMNEYAPQEIKVVHAAEQRIEYCKGCFTCMHNGGDCVINDGMRGILDEILKSDLLLLSFPLYCYGMPAPLKALIDRTLPLSGMAMRKVGERYEHVGQADVGRLRFLMICGCGFPNSSQNFEPAVVQFRLLFRGAGAAVTVPESPMLNVPEAEPVTAPRLALVREAGRVYAETGEISEKTLAALRAPMIPEEQYAAIVNAGA